MNRFGRWAVAVCAAIGLVHSLASQVAAEVRLPRVIRDNMVIQRDVQAPIWGWAEPGEEVTVALGGQKAVAKADAKGNWMVRFPAMKAGGPHEMTVSGKNTIQVKNVLVGEVWIGSGQSNMEMSVGGSQNAKEEIAAADFPRIRLFQVPKRPSGYPVNDVEASWVPCSPGTVGGFSAVAYFFGREIHKQLDVPVGLLHPSWGGTRIEPWTPPEGFAATPKLEGIAKQIEQADAAFRKQLQGSLDGLEAWVPAARKALAANEPVPPMPPFAQHALHSAGQPTGLYNGMVYPLVPYAIRGALWYQGESNRGEGMLYFEKMKALIGGWRKVWGQGDFPFYYVQLAPFRYGGSATALPEIWEAQTAALTIPNTGMAVTTDIATVGNIHPPNKQDVGKRLALWALATDYGKKDLVYSGPLYKGMEVEIGEIRIQFDHVGGGLAPRDGKPLTHFQIAGADRNFVPAEARIDKGTVVVSSNKVADPVAVRFAWHQEAEPNLMNKEGLPASPFRTDRW